MPNKCPHPCNQPGCHKLTTERFCVEHAKAREQQYDKQRGTAAERGYTSRWQKARLSFLHSHPLCAECEREGRLTPATVVDHIIAHKGDQTRFWDESNWQALCKRHHDVKTSREDGRWG